MLTRRARDPRQQRGAIGPMFAIVLPLLMFLIAMTFDIGNWFVHARHLQTKVDAGAFAGATAWSFPCGADSDTDATGTGIKDLARKYVGPHTMADGNPSPFNATAVNPQVGTTKADHIHVVLNGTDYFDEDSNPTVFDGNLTSHSSICESMMLDVKGTESNAPRLFGWLPFFPDIKRKARIRMFPVDDLRGLLPISVRVPKPVSAAAVFYDEDDGTILDAVYFCEKPNGFTGLPAGLGGWTTYDPAHSSGLCGSRASLNVAEETGVAIATSFRPACNATASPPVTTNCLDLTGFATVNDLCRQGASSGRVKCFFSTGTGSAQTVQSGLQFIRGYEDAPPVTDGPPKLRGAWLNGLGCTGGYGSGYFASVTGSCGAELRVKIDLGSVLEDIPPTPPNEAVETRKAGNVEVRYRLVRADGTSYCDYGANCALQTGNPDATGTVEFSTLGTSSSPHLPITPRSRGNAVAIEIRLGGSSATPNPGGCGPGNDPNNLCRWFYTGTGGPSPSVPPTDAAILAAPIQRSFMGDDDTSGPIKFLRLSADTGCNGNPDGSDNAVENYTDGPAGSQPIGQEHCFVVDMGLTGGTARDQDQPPIAFNLSGSSQGAVLDCDPVLDNLKDEIIQGCSPRYKKNDFLRDPPCPAGIVNWNGLLSPPAPYNTEWPPYTCTLTQTTAAPAPGHLISGFNERFFGTASNPSCPTENRNWTGPPERAPFTRGRNYWHDANNFLDEYTFAQDNPPPTRKDRLRDDDPRKVRLFMTAYDSFGGSGNEIFPIVAFGTFYVTGYGRVAGGSGLSIDDPCGDGNNGNLFDGTGNEPPPDLNTARPGTYIWGHFISDFVPAGSGTPDLTRPCAPEESPEPCVPALVE